MDITFVPTNLKVNYTKPEYAVADTQSPVFSWGAIHAANGSRQKAYRVVVIYENEILWDSGFVESSQLSCVYSGMNLPSGAVVKWSLELIDSNNNKSQKAESTFRTACFEDFEGEWISSESEKEHEVIYFKKDFELLTKPCRAVLYYCGIGLSKPYLNGNKIDDYYLQPAHSNYKKECYYVTVPIDVSVFNEEKNFLMVQVAGGWRKNYGVYLDNMSSDRKIEFMGDICLFAQLDIYFEDGTKQIVATDESWLAGNGPIRYSHLFNGEIYDENIETGDFAKVKISEFIPEKLTTQYTEPVCIKDEIKENENAF